MVITVCIYSIWIDLICVTRAGLRSSELTLSCVTHAGLLTKMCNARRLTKLGVDFELCNARRLTKLCNARKLSPLHLSSGLVSWRLGLHCADDGTSYSDGMHTAEIYRVVLHDLLRCIWRHRDRFQALMLAD